MSRLELGHVGEPALSAAGAHCPLCGHEGTRRPYLRLQPDPAVDLVECGHCGGLSADRLPSSEFLDALYDPTHYASSLVSEQELSDRCARGILDAVELDSDRLVSIVDFGGSDGTLSRSIRRQLLSRGHRGDIRSTVVDLYPREDSPHQRFIDPETFEKSNDVYDLVVASAVLEHLPSPGAAIRSLLAHAAQGSYFYARTPWDAPLQRVVPGYRVKWPRHLHDLGPRFWDRFLGTFEVSGAAIVSRPSIVESSLRRSPLRTALAHLLKAPSRFENAYLRPALGYSKRLWPFVGGWEVVFRLDGPSG